MTRSSRRTVCAAVAAVTAAALLTLAVAPDGVGAQSPYPPRDGVVANGTAMSLSVERINNDFRELIGEPYSQEGLALVVDDCSPDPEVYLDQALVHYGMSPRAGAINNDALAWLVCMSPRFVGLFFASENDFSNVLDEDRATDVMVQDLRDENFTGAFTGSIDEVANQLALSSYMPDLGDARSGAGAVASEDDESGGGRNWLAALLALAAAGGGVWWWRRRSKPKDQVDEPSVAKPVTDLERKLAELNERLTPENTSQARLVLAYESMGDKTILALDKRHDGMLRRLAALNQQAAALRTSYDTGGIDDAQIQDLWEPPLAEADALLKYVDDLDAEAEHVEMLKARAPVLAVEAREAIETARLQYSADAHDLELPSADDALSFPAQLTDAAEAALTDGQRITAGRLAEDAAEIATRTGAVPGSLSRLDGQIDETALLFERLDAYAESSWADIRGNGSEADESLDASTDMFSRVVAADQDAFGPDAGAGYLASLDEMDGELARATRLIEAVHERFTFLQNARESTPKAIADVEREIDEGKAWLAQPDVDADVSTGPVDALAAAEGVLAEARTEARSPKPDWVVVLRKLNEADRLADQALAAARAEKDLLAARARQVAAARTEAAASIDRAERFLGSHRADATAPSVEQVGEARAHLARAEVSARAADRLQDVAMSEALVDVVAMFEQALEQGQAAYDALASDVARAEEKRRQYVPRPNWMGPTVPIPIDLRPMSRSGRRGGGWASRPKRKSSWGSRPRSSGPKVRKGGSSSRRGGGRGW